MSFTEDELQSFNAVLEQRLSAHRREMERFFDQHIHDYRRDIEQRLLAMQQEILRNVTLKLGELHNKVESALSEKMNTQQARLLQAISQDVEQKREQFEGSVDHKFEAQLSGIEAIVHQQLRKFTMPDVNEEMSEGAEQPHLAAIEVQTDISWEDLVDAVGKALDERLADLNEAIQRSLQRLEHYLSARMHALQSEAGRVQSQPVPGSMTNLQEVLHGIEHLENTIESLQVAMTANHALISNRLYHHQQLPLERAHPHSQAHLIAGNGTTNAFTLAKERIASGLPPEPVGRTEVEEQQEE